MKRTYQFSASANGWRNAKPILIHNLIHEQATAIAYGYAILFDCEVRYADITGFDSLQERNDKGEHLGNGGYLCPNTAQGYFSGYNAALEHVD